MTAPHPRPTTKSPTGERWMAVGRSSNADPQKAGAEAARGAMAGGDDPRLVIVFAAHSYDGEGCLPASARRPGRRR